MDFRQTLKVYEAVYHNTILEIVYIKYPHRRSGARKTVSEPSRSSSATIAASRAIDTGIRRRTDARRAAPDARRHWDRRDRTRPRQARDPRNQHVRDRLERAKGIEPSYEAWEASVLPLNYARSAPLTLWQERRDSNPQPPVLETGALPIELHSYRALFCRIARADASVRRRAPRAVSATSGGLAAEGSNGRRATLGLAKLPIDPPATPGCRRRKELTATPCRTGERGRPVPRTRPWRWSSRWDSRGTSSTRPRSAASPTA